MREKNNVIIRKMWIPFEMIRFERDKLAKKKLLLFLPNAFMTIVSGSQILSVSC